MQPSSPVPDPSLIDRTNVFQTQPAAYPPSSPSDRKRVNRLELVGRDKKRVKIDVETHENGDVDLALDADAPSDSEDEGADGHGYKDHPSQYSVYHLRNQVFRGRSRFVDMPTRFMLRSFVSSNKSDVFKCHSIHEGSLHNIPYACSYSNGAKRGETPHIAVATEQGTVDILNTSKRDDWDVEPQRVTVQPHANGVFDVRWSPSDTLLATASGDHTVRISTLSSSVASQDRTLHILRGHAGTVKSIAWDPAHDGTVLCSGGRDGWICLWDLRVGERSASGEISPVFSIPMAHDLEGKASRSKSTRGRLVPGMPLQSITSLLYTDTHPYGIVSSCCADGIVNLWDVRLPSNNKRSKAKKTSKQLVKPLYTSTDPTAAGGSRRGRGITTLAGGSGPTAALVFALGIDSRVHTYTLPSLQALSGHTAPEPAPAPAPIPSTVVTYDDPHAFSDPRMRTNSFYVRMATSPCGRWLAAGSATGGRAYLYDISLAGRAGGISSAGWGAGVELKGQLGEMGAVDWADGMLATCADDGTVRVWRPDLEVSRQCRTDPDEMRWNWAWSTDA